jgi:hypothetical protein
MRHGKQPIIFAAHNLNNGRLDSFPDISVLAAVGQPGSNTLIDAHNHPL